MTTEQLKKLEQDLWLSATRMRSDSDLKLNEISVPILGLIFLKFADNRFSNAQEKIQKELKAQEGSRKQTPEHEIAIRECGFFLPPQARYEYLLHLPEKEDIAKAIKEAMVKIEEYKPELKDTLPKDEYYKLTRTDKALPKTLLKTFQDIPKDATGDVFGKVYEFFVEKFAFSDATDDGEHFTPTSVVKYMVEVIEPYEGSIYDPACGSGGMFVQSSYFVEKRRKELKDDNSKDLYVYGGEKVAGNVGLAKMNLAVHGLRGEIKQANAFYENPHDSFGKFDYVMANPPFNVKDVNYARVKDDTRFSTYGIPKNKGKAKKGEVELVPNANYLWINLFATSLKEKGRAALVMANSASDARHSEKDIRERLVKKGIISQMVSLTSNMFNTVTLPASLWFFNKAREIESFETEQNDIKVLFVDARNVYRQVDRAHREFTDEQVWNLATITRLHRGENERFTVLIHDYYTEVASRLNEVSQYAESSIKHLQEVITPLKKWFQQTAFTKEQQAFIEQQKLSEVLGAMLPPDASLLATALAHAENALKKYNSTSYKDYQAQNKAQHEVAIVLEELVKERRTFKKALDKAFRNTENAYKQADKELKDKNDKTWKAIPSLKEAKTSLDAFAEYTNSDQNREPQHLDKSAFYYIKMAAWLQERFPEAKYEDVTGLCKVADIHEIAEQDYSLNPGRYVGVVIEEDGMTEEEYFENLSTLKLELESLTDTSNGLLEKIKSDLNSLFEKS